MNMETMIQWLGGLLAYVALGIVLYGIWQGIQQQVGRTVGLSSSWFRSWWFYLASTLFFIGIAYLGWKPLPLSLSPSTRVVILVIGALLYFPGFLILLWARFSLGKYYFVSTGFGAQLFKDHELVTNGPYAIVRHPMYVGLILASVGALFIYLTWTTVYFVLFAPLTLVRAWREEQVLSDEYGGRWQGYCRQVPMLVPRLWKE